ncbi:hypothetical protein ACJX0J_041698, partial [Zea mays]
MMLKDFLSRAGVAVDALRIGCTSTRRSRRSTPNVFLSYLHSQAVGQKRRVARGDGVVERTVEWRQKRMIKNCEAIARSWARKQAYTNELENKIILLEEKNEHLKKLKLRIRKLMWSLPCLCLH